jgi:ABC-2 type transport system permease protein
VTGSRAPWRPLLALIRKELVQALRDRRMLFLISVAPLVQIVVFGYAAQLEFRRADTVFVDQDRTAESRALRDDLGADRTFVVRDAPDVEAAVAAIRDGDAAVAVVVPRGFARDRRAGRAAAIQVLADGSDPTRGAAATAAIEGFAASRLAPPPGVARPGQLVLEPRLLYNPRLQSQRFFVPGTAASLLVIITTLVTAMGLAREREIGTLEQLLVTPIGPFTLMVGKMTPYALFGLVDVALILLIGNLLFDVPLHGDLWVLAVATACYLLCTLSLGLLIAASATTQQRAFMAGFFVMLPLLLLSGFMTPIEAMPSWIEPLTRINPMRYLVHVMRSVLLRGAGWADVQLAVLWLLGIGVALLVGAARRFRRQLA